jgi:methylmalonyl-CoA/ethylmalonyl-CoA epimerase
MKHDKLHHYGLATKSIDEAVKLFLLMGYSVTSEKIVDNIQKVEILFLQKDSDHFIELIAPLEGVDGPICQILKKMGSSVYHICYSVKNIDNSINEYKNAGFSLIMKPTQAVAFNNKKICFLYSSFIGLIELVEI